MTGLLDAHGLVWWLTDDPRLSRRAHAFVSDPASRIMVSAATVWEIAIKVAQGRLTLPSEPARLREVLVAERMIPLVIEFEHVIAAAALPPIHRDPFDRLLVAQAQSLGIPVITADPAIVRYGVQTIW